MVDDSVVEAQPAARPRSTGVPVVALVGNPNTGKSTVFNRLTGLRQKVGNYPGVTVEQQVGRVELAEGSIDLVDVPGTYSLAAHAKDELVAIDVLTGTMPNLDPPAAVLATVDAGNLRRNLFLLTQLLELERPLVIALNMMDEASGKGLEIDAEALGEALGCRVVPVVARRGHGIDALARVLSEVVHGSGAQATPVRRPWPALERAMDVLREHLGPALDASVPRYVLARAILDVDGAAEARLRDRVGEDADAAVAAARATLGNASQVAALEARERYRWVDEIVGLAQRQVGPPARSVDRLDQLVAHPALGPIIFVAVMAVIFQAVFAWATPFMEAIDAGVSWLSLNLAAVLPPGALQSLAVDGVIAGVGSVIIFLPQIVILFAFIILLEDSGYMARGAMLTDRLMRVAGLSGQSFLPMLSSFACAVPGIMAARVVPDHRDRLATILAAPFMTCSARLPVYALLIGAFVPPVSLLGGWLNLQGLVLLGLYLLGIVGGVFTAWLLKHTLLRAPAPAFVIELPPYRLPRLGDVVNALATRVGVFLRRAGTVIFVVSMIVWATSYFPRPAAIGAEYDVLRDEVRMTYADEALTDQLAALNVAEGRAYLEASLLGQAGRAIQPVFEPLGWDWTISAAVVASFPAREVVVAVLGTLYAVGDGVGQGLADRLRSATDGVGQPLFTLPVVLGLLVFYAFCMQCGATLAVMARETGGWVWPLAAWLYMTGLAYLSALLVVHLARAVGL